MKGMRPLSEEEVTLVLTKFKGKYALRDKVLLILGMRTGFRISEMLSLKVKDVWQHGKPLNTVAVTKANMKGKIESRCIPLHSQVQAVLKLYIKDQSPDDWLFPSQCGGHISRQAAHKLLHKAFDVCQLEGSLGTHCMRKAFANTMYERLGHDLVKTQKALGHKWVNTTAQYISFREDEVNEAILAS